MTPGAAAVPSIGETLVGVGTIAVVLFVLGRLAAWWITQPIPYPVRIRPEHCVCRGRARFSVSATLVSLVTLNAAIFTGYATGSWFSVAGLVGSVVALVVGQRFLWQTRWAHRADRCCCPGQVGHYEGVIS